MISAHFSPQSNAELYVFVPAEKTKTVNEFRRLGGRVVHAYRGCRGKYSSWGETSGVREHRAGFVRRRRTYSATLRFFVP
jgi:hypothetical protein